MTAVRSRSSSKSLAYTVALMTILALVVPFAGTALATHPAGCTLEVREEVDSNPSGTTHTLTAQLYTGSTDGACAAGALPVEIDFEAESGPQIRACTPTATSGDNCPPGTGQPGAGTATGTETNDPQTPDLGCSIATASSSCTVTFTSDGTGTNIIRAWIDENRASNSSTDTSVEADATEGRYSGPTDCGLRSSTTSGVANGCDRDASNQALTAVPGATNEPDITDVVQKTWTQSVAAACIDAEPETDNNPSGTEHTITAKATNSATAPADAAGTFDCTGTALANTRVVLTYTDDEPNIFVKSVNGTATGGPTAGGPNTATGTTDANGQITFVIQCVSGTAANCTGTNTDLTVTVEGAQTGTSVDVVQKTWTPAGTAASLDATPENDTNEVGQTHVITCKVADNFGAGVAGENCDAQVTGGPNSDNDIGTGGNTTNGYIGQCTTGADGTCTVSYTSTETGTDQITVFRDLNGNDLQDGTETAAANFDAITKTWVAAGQGTADVDVDLSGCDDLANGTDDTADDTTATNELGQDAEDTHVMCAERFGPTGVRQEGPVTFTVTSGSGFLCSDSNGDDDCTDTGESKVTTLTVQESTAGNIGFNEVTIYSNKVGSVVVNACAEGTTICSSGTKTFTQETVAAARNINCEPPSQNGTPGGTAVVTCTVTDRNGNPVKGVAVTGSEVGPGRITSTNPATTNAAGQVEFVLETTASESGTQTLTAEITGGRVPGANNDECESAANRTAGSTTDNLPGTAAGNCTDTATVNWGAPPPPPPPPPPLERGPCSGFAPGSRTPRSTGGFVIVGTEGNDILDGSGGPDLICGLGGDDVIDGRGSGDQISGGGGNDNIGGGGGKDNITGGGGDDVISGNRGNDAIKGGRGNDSLKGNAGIDTLTGGAGNDTLQGGNKSDILKGGDGNDTLRGGKGDDALDGGPGNDQCFGGPGDDSVRRCE